MVESRVPPSLQIQMDKRNILFWRQMKGSKDVCLKSNRGEPWCSPGGDMLIAMVVNRDHLFENYWKCKHIPYHSCDLLLS